MNRRPTLLAALALTATAALTLSACGSDDDSPAKDKDAIAGADTGGKKSASPATSAPASDDRPKIELPGDLADLAGRLEGWSDTTNPRNRLGV